MDNLQGSADRRIAALEAENESLRKEIAAQRVAEGELRAALERFRDFAEIASEWLWEMGPDLRFTAVTKQYEHATGIRAESLIGKRREELGVFGPGDEKLALHLADLEARRPFRNFEYSRIGENGAPVYFSVSGRPVFGRDGRFHGYRGVARDITLRKIAERELREARDLSRAVMDAVPFEFVLKDTEGRYIQVNRAWERAFGCPGGKAIGKLPQDIIPGKFSEIFARRDRQVLEEGRHLEAQEQALRADGSVRDFLAVRFPLADAGGKIKGLGLIAMDITERKAVERALEEREEQLRTVIDNLPALVLRFDRQRRIAAVNRTGEQWYARPASEIVGKTVVEVLGEEIGERLKPHLRSALAGQVVSFEVNVPYPDGVCRDIEATYVPDRAPDGTVQGVFALIQDGTARKAAERALRESEARLRAIVENSPAAIYLKDLDGRFLISSNEHLKWCGLPLERVLGRTAHAIFPTECADDYAEQDRRVIESGKVDTSETKVVQRDGTIRDIVANKFPVYGDDGHIVAVGGVDLDITPIKRLETELLRKERLAAMGQLTGTVAHELRNPLGAIATTISVLRMKCARAGLDVERALGRAERGVKRCDRIITELLDFARAKGLQRQATVLDDCLSGILEEVEIPSGIESVFSPGCPDMTVWVDREGLLRAMVNVVDNACHAMASGADRDGPDGQAAGRLAIETRPGGGRACITVSDTGPGMSPNVLAQVLEPLFSTKSFGTGLGLPTVKRIMEDHGGGLEIDSAAGKGTRVVLWLPLGDGAGGEDRDWPPVGPDHRR